MQVQEGLVARAFCDCWWSRRFWKVRVVTHVCELAKHMKMLCSRKGTMILNRHGPSAGCKVQ